MFLANTFFFFLLNWLQDYHVHIVLTWAIKWMWRRSSAEICN